MPRPAPPSNCHKPAGYVEGDEIWYYGDGMPLHLHHGKGAGRHR